MRVSHITFALTALLKVPAFSQQQTQYYWPQAPQYQPSANTQYQWPTQADAPTYYAKYNQSFEQDQFQPKWYASLHGEFAIVEDFEYRNQRSTTVFEQGSVSFDTGIGFGAALGYQFHPWFRVESEITYRTHDGEDAEAVLVSNGSIVDRSTVDGDDLGLNTFNLMVNGIMDIPVHEKVIPYVGAGAGMTYKTNGNTETLFSYQGLAGVRYKVNSMGSVKLGYRFFETSGYEIGDFEYDGTSHIIEFGFIGNL